MLSTCVWSHQVHKGPCVSSSFGLHRIVARCLALPSLLDLSSVDPGVVCCPIKVCTTSRASTPVCRASISLEVYLEAFILVTSVSCSQRPVVVTHCALQAEGISVSENHIGSLRVRHGRYLQAAGSYQPIVRKQINIEPNTQNFSKYGWIQ